MVEEGCYMKNGRELRSIKCLVIVVLLLIALTVSGCTERKIEKLNAGEFIYLDASEYNIYEKEKLLEDSVLMKSSVVSFQEIQKTKYPDKNLLTKRDITVGSTASEIAEKYQGYPCAVIVESDRKKIELLKSITFNGDAHEAIGILGIRLNEGEKVLDYYMVRYESYCIDGKYTSEQVFLDHLTKNGVDINVNGAPPEKIKGADSFVLLFYMENDAVTDIYIRHY